MLRLLKYLIFGHVCTYETIEGGYITDNGRRIGKYYMCRCKTCGRWKRFDMKKA